MAILEPSILSITDASYYLFGHFTTFEIASVPLGLEHDIRFPCPASLRQSRRVLFLSNLPGVEQEERG